MRTGGRGGQPGRGSLLALAVGVPAMLLARLGNPFPNWSTLKSGNLDDSAVLHLLACVVWIAWLQWIFGTVLESRPRFVGSACRGTSRPARA